MKYRVLVTGNHDCGIAKYIPLFNEIYRGALFIGEKLLLSHEPIDLPFALNIHGHTHGEKGYHYDINHFNVCSNCVNFEPQNLQEIIKTSNLKDIKTIHRLAIDKAIERKENEKSMATL